MTDPRVAEILALTDFGILKTIPATPLGAQLPHLSLPKGQNIPITPAAPVQVPLTDEEREQAIEALLNAADPLISIARMLVTTRKITWSQGIDLAGRIRDILSMTASTVLPELKGESARELVIAATSVLVVRYVKPLLPLWMQPFVTGSMLRTVINGLETSYQTVIKPKLNKAS